MIWKHACHQLVEEITLFRYNLSVSEDTVRSCVTGRIDYSVRELAESKAGREMQERIKSIAQACELERLPGLEILAKAISPFSQSCKSAEVLERPPRECFRPDKHSEKCSTIKQEMSQDGTFPGSGPQMDQWTCSQCGYLNVTFSPIENDQNKLNCVRCDARKEAVSPILPEATARHSRSQKASASNKQEFTLEPPQPKHKCECGAELKISEVQCESCEALAYIPVKREGKMWKCLNCGKDNPAGQDTCRLCFRRKPTRALIVDTSPKCQQCSRLVATGESLCLVCKQKQRAKLQENKWMCKYCKTSNSQGTCTTCRKARTCR